jgi:selenocysteine-specific elongation factor
MRSIIVGTAGHIDHGKTTLVQALTGVDTDRLPEEKRRGITIDLGFAELDLGDVRVGFVDVPGHERFVKNMLAGAHGIDLVMLVVAADEGVMPQTREHFEICRLLGLKTGLIAITKIDTVEEELLDLVREEIAELVAGSFLDGAPMLPVSGRTGQGTEELKATIQRLAFTVLPRASDVISRLPVDRSFSVRGFGTVATGTLVAGELLEGAELELLPVGKRVRLRGIQVHGKSVPSAVAGQRTALNLSGVEVSEVQRGMVLAPSDLLLPSQILDVKIELLGSCPKPLRSRSRLRVHLGTAELLGRVRILEGVNEIQPGGSGFAQLSLESPVTALAGDRFIIRSYSPSHTIGGGIVLDALAIKHKGRETAAVRKRLAELETGSLTGKVAIFVEAAGEAGLDIAALTAQTGLRTEQLEPAITAAVKAGSLVRAEMVLISTEIFKRLVSKTLKSLEAHHREAPLSRGIARETLKEQIFSHKRAELFKAVLTHLQDVGVVVSDREVVRMSGHSVELSEGDVNLKQRIEKLYLESRFEPPSTEEALRRLTLQAREKERAAKLLRLLIDGGELVRVSNDLLFHRNALSDLLIRIRDYAAAKPADRLIDVATFKEIAQVSRKYAIPLLEYLDRQHVTRRAGEKRIIL